ncbi:MAG: hypothetical protein E3J73_05320 [Candidatus Bathyarchaeum sp.]|nr:MAG: hypothetical protein E3J73_05320 [Candidatus Bathyarchaeum sp.]
MGLSRQASASRTALDEVFVFRLKALHSILAPLMYDSLKNKLATDKAFKQKYEEWVKKQGWTLDEERHSNIADQGAYILINKILFYKALERKKNLPPLTKKENVAELLEILRECFGAALKIDYRAVFQRDPIYDEIPLTPEVAQRLNILIDEVSEYDLSKMKRDVIGTLYEKLIPKGERRALGQFYTPPQIVELVVKMCITSPDDKVLDPACGSGGFLVASYDCLLELKGKTKTDDETHQELLSQIWGIDINKFPAHLATINLATQNLESKSDFVNVIVSDFFDIREPEQKILAPWSGITPDGKREIIEIPQFDVVVANPPYIRQEDIADKKKVRKHLQRIGIKKMTARSDVFCYFFTHSREFLRESGKIGFVTSERWLDVGYGKALQQFFLDNFKIHAIITFDKKVFDEPMVGSCITILEECGNKKSRDNHFTNFLRVKERLQIEEIIKKAKTQSNSEFSKETEEYRLTSIRQTTLRKSGKWNRFLFAPRIYFDITNHTNTCTLKTLADVKFGIKTGANDFFYFRGKERIKEYELGNFTFPIVKGIGQLQYIGLEREDTDWYTLDLHKVVNDIVKDFSKSKRNKDQPLSERIKEEMKKRGLNGLVRYIEIGERNGINLRPTCASRKVWFDIGNIDTPPLISSACYWKQFMVLYNIDGSGADHYFYYISLYAGVDAKLLGGILNSTLARVLVEVDGRIAKGQALDRITIMVYETKNLRIPNPRRMAVHDKQKISLAFEEILKRERFCDEVERAELQRKLDVAVLKTLGMEGRLEELYNAAEILLQRRIKGGAEQTEVLVGPEVEHQKPWPLSSEELEDLVTLLQLSKVGRLTEEQESTLGRRAGMVVRDLAYEIIRLRHEPMSVKDTAQRILDIEDDVLSLAGYYEVISEIMGRKTTPKQVIRDLLSIWRDQPEGIEKTVSRLLSGDGRFLQIESRLFGLREWSPNELFQIYVQLVSKYRTTDYEKKETFKGEAIRLLESGEVDFPDKDGLIQTLRRL